MMKADDQEAELLICPGCDSEYEPRHGKDIMCLACYSKQGKRSKRKGSANENRFAKYLNGEFEKHKLLHHARRTPRSGAIKEIECADIMIKAKGDSIFKRLHFENKNTDKWDINGWYKKIEEQEKEIELFREPVIIARRPNDTKEFAIIDAKFLVKLLINIDLLQ